MSYLYGDSTDSNLELNYIEFLRDALDLAVQMLLCDSRVRTMQSQGVTRKDVAEAELERLKFISQNLKKALDDSAVGATDSIAGQCVADLRKSVAGSVQQAANRVKQKLTDDLKAIENQAIRERGSNNKALEKLLLKHDLPGSAHRVEVRLSDSTYQARMSGSSKIGVSWILDLTVPASSLYAAAVRVDKLAPTFEVKLPDKNGWTRGKVKLRTQKLTNKYVTGLVHGPNESRLRLRQQPDDKDTGYDILFSTAPAAVPVRVVRIKNGDVEGSPFDPATDDAQRFLELRKQLLEAAKPLMAKRKALVEARLDNKPIAEHDSPATLAQRLISNMAPVVQQISQHSLSPKELVLKRVLADDRREEIFVSKADLLKKLRPVPVELRGVFAPLGLGNLEGDDIASASTLPSNGARAKATSAPPPIAGKKPPPRPAPPSKPPPLVVPGAPGADDPTSVRVRKPKDTASAAEKALASLGDD